MAIAVLARTARYFWPPSTPAWLSVCRCNMPIIHIIPWLRNSTDVDGHASLRPLILLCGPSQNFFGVVSWFESTEYQALVTDAWFHEILQRGRHGPARDHRPGSRQMATPLGVRLGDRPLRRLFRDHVDVLPRLAAAARGRGSSHGRRSTAGRPASSYTGSLVQSSGCNLWRRRGAGGGSACRALHASTEAACRPYRHTFLKRPGANSV
jgi:hypothetical protein